MTRIKTKRTRNKRDEAMRFIIRMDYEQAKGWMVRLYKKGERDPVAVKFFSDNRHINTNKALDAAKMWRDEQVKIHNLDQYKHVDAPKAHICDTRSKSGAVGVSLAFKASSSSGAIHAYWLAKAMNAGETKIKHWSIRRHGYQGAWKKAADYRAKLTGHPATNDSPPAPEERLVKWAKEYGVDL